MNERKLISKFSNELLENRFEFFKLIFPDVSAQFRRDKNVLGSPFSRVTVRTVRYDDAIDRQSSI